MLVWFRRTYNLAPTDPRYLDATMEEIVTEYWTRHYDERLRNGQASEEEFENDEYEAELAEMMTADDFVEV